MNKKAYMRTIEAFIAFLITFIFIMFVVYKGISPKVDDTDFDVLNSLESRDDFRNCVYERNSTCVENLVSPFIPAAYTFKISIGPSAPFKGSKDIYTETLFMVSNTTDNTVIVYLYYWPKSG